MLGREITYQQDGQTLTGKALEIDDSGRLIIENSSGRSALRSGEISIVMGDSIRNP